MHIQARGLSPLETCLCLSHLHMIMLTGLLPSYFCGPECLLQRLGKQYKEASITVCHYKGSWIITTQRCGLHQLC